MVDLEAGCPLQGPARRTTFVFLMEAVALKVNCDGSEYVQTVESNLLWVLWSGPQRKDYAFIMVEGGS